MIKRVNTPDAPKAIGPYSQATIFNNLIYTSGQISIDPKTQDFINDSIEKQTEQVLRNIQAILESSGSSLTKILKTTIYIKNIGDFDKVNIIYKKYITENPARSTIEVSNLPKNALIEIECIAAI